jgi:hypothetical protein
MHTTSQTLADLQATLVDRLAKLDEERRLNAEANAKERAELIEIAASDRTKQLESIRVAEEKAKQRKIEEQEYENERLRKEREAQIAVEQKLNAAAELERQHREKLEWLTNEISKAEFVEEQHRKHLENLKVLPPVETTDGAEVSVEYPQTCADGGASATGTEGNTPDTPLMSQHLRGILRQANRPQ